MSKFTNKVVFITGASSGIGAALARIFAAEGASVVIVARREEKLKDLAAEIQQHGGKVLAVECDVNSETDLQNAVEKTHQAFGNINIVIANAGYALHEKFDKTNFADLERQFQVNVFGVYRTIYATLNDLKKTSGQLALMGSVAAYISTPTMSLYCMSKAAIRAMADALYAELRADGIAVTLISPGFVASEIGKIDKYGVYDPNAKESVPRWIKMPAEKAARKMVNAIYAKKREVIITFHGKLALFFNWLIPGMIPRYFRRQSKRQHKG